MKKIEFKGETYTIPTSWNDITLDKQIQVSRDEKEYKNDYTKKLAIISGYCDIPVEVIKKSKPSEAAQLFNYMKFISQDRPKDAVTEFKFKGDTYYVAQNLAEGEFQDYVSMETAIQNNEGKLYEVTPYLMAILCKRKKDDGQLETLDDYDINERAEMFKQIPITIAEPLALFFYQLEKVSKINSLLYSNPQVVIQKKIEEVENSMKGQVGKGLLSRLLIMILRKYVRFIKKDVMKSLNSTRSKSSKGNWKAIFKKLLTKKRNKMQKKEDKN